VASFNKADTISAILFMDTDFLQWLYQEAVEGRWDQSMVFEAVVKEELDGKSSFSPNIKPAFEFSSTGFAADYKPHSLGRFELLPGEERDGSPVYQQAHSKEMPENNEVLLFRSGDKWLVNGYKTYLKASAAANPFLPPTSGWLFGKGIEFEEDHNLTCSLPESSPPCCLTLTLSGAAKEALEHCEGEYRSTGLMNTGRKVFKLEGSDDHFLFADGGDWSICSSLKKEKVYIRSGSGGQACPAHPRNASNVWFGIKEWKFNKADDDWEEGGVVLHCSVHTK